MRVRLTYFQVDEELEFRFSHDYTADALDAVVTDLLTQYAPWAKRAAEWQRISRVSLAALQFPFPGYRPGQRAMIGAVYKICTEGGQLLCQAPTGIGKTMSVLFPALKAVGQPRLLPDSPRHDPCGSGERAVAAAGVRRPFKAAQRNADRQGQNLYAGSARVYARGMPLCQRLL